MNTGKQVLFLISLCALSLSTHGAEPYSPYVNQSWPEYVYWGDTHLHTYLSADAFALGTRITPDEAYRFAKGETIRATGGGEVRLQVPLDFLMVADHAENLGVLRRLAAGDPELRITEDGKRFAKVLADAPELTDLLSADTLEEFNAGSQYLINAKSTKGGDYGIDENFKRGVWFGVIDIAEKHNNPGKFTTFVGYEYSSASLHRNVLFSGSPKQTRQILPFSRYDSKNPEDLWAYLQRYKDKVGSDVISIPHNSNLSRGKMFKSVTWEGNPLTEAYARIRSSIEPITEVTQIKGDSETHPSVSPDDEFAEFESWRDFSSTISTNAPVNPATTSVEDLAKQSFVRPALKSGLALQSNLGVNPFKFGMIGSTDSHNGLAAVAENNYWGKMGVDEPNPWRSAAGSRYASSGYAAVWAQENTRASIFAAMKRREVYATTGPRISLRFFGGWDFTGSDASSPNLAAIGYQKGVPMGGDLVLAEQIKDKSPNFLIRAVKDPNGANLDRIQIIKGWRDEEGNLFEKVHDIAWSDNRETGEDGKLEAVGTTVDLANASYLNSIGSAELSASWTDPDFDRNEYAFYYVRVIQIPTPRWTTYDAAFYGLEELPTTQPATIQERAYSSPIWYTP